ncbi:MAG: SPW repeat domain-containing protein [Moorellales bacterium]
MGGAFSRARDQVIPGTEVRTVKWAKWINLILGILVIIIPFCVGTSANLTALLANIILGVLVVVFGFLMPTTGGKEESGKAAKA